MPSVFLKVYGKVQGVFFRQSTQVKANELGITGLVSNATDGTVEITAQGEEQNLNYFILWCHRGPERARVDTVETRNVPGYFSFDSFEIRYR